MSDPCHLDVLDRPACLALLATAGVARVVFTIRALPAVQPVRFVITDDAVVFGVAAGSALFAGIVDTVIAVEADHFDADTAAGWFVTVLGRATKVGDGTQLAELMRSRQLDWPGGDDSWIRIPIESVFGRRLPVHPGTPPQTVTGNQA
jgi:hypothetical protein